MKIKLLLFALLSASLVCVSLFADAKEDQDKAMMDAIMKAAAPGTQHKLLSQMEGTWKATVKTFMDPSKPPDVTEVSCVHKMIMGGRFLQQQCSGQMMNAPWEGTGMTGYDNLKQKYVGTWADSWGTGIMNSEGTETEPGKVITLTSQMQDPMMGVMQLREVLRIVSDKEHVFEMYTTGKDGKEMKMMEITYNKQ
jgi:hypothetical protein